jgi:hypothetical protein
MSTSSSNGSVHDQGLANDLIAGHSVEVISATLVPARAEYPEGTIPDFEVRIRNPGKATVRLCTYMLRYRLQFALTARTPDGPNFGLYPFQQGKWDTFQPRDFVTLAPGKTHVEKLELSKLQGWGWYRLNDQPPMLTWSGRLLGFPAATYTFTTAILPVMALYTGLDGAHDHTIDRRSLPEQIPGLPPGDYRNVARDEVTVKANVKFIKKA